MKLSYQGEHGVTFKASEPKVRPKMKYGYPHESYLSTVDNIEFNACVAETLSKITQALAELEGEIEEVE